MESKEQPKAPEFLVLPTVLVNDVLSYLGSKPYTESAPYINAIQSQAKVFEPSVTEDKKEEK